MKKIILRFGRTGIYQMQELARLVNEEVYDRYTTCTGWSEQKYNYKGCRNTELENIFHLLRSMGTGVFAKQNVLRRLDPTLYRDSIFYER